VNDQPGDHHRAAPRRWWALAGLAGAGLPAQLSPAVVGALFVAPR
jgi:hypothetical protein